MPFPPSLTDEKVKQIRIIHRQAMAMFKRRGLTRPSAGFIKRLAQQFEVSRQTVHRVVKGQRYKYAPGRAGRPRKKPPSMK